MYITLWPCSCTPNIFSLKCYEMDGADVIIDIEIDKEDVHDRKKWRMNVMKRTSNPIGNGL